MNLNIMIFSLTLNKNATLSIITLYSECSLFWASLIVSIVYTECLSVWHRHFMLNVIILSVALYWSVAHKHLALKSVMLSVAHKHFMLKIIMLSVGCMHFILNVIMLSVVTLRVVAPMMEHNCTFFNFRYELLFGVATADALFSLNDKQVSTL